MTEQHFNPQLRFARFLPRTVITSRTLPALRVLTRLAGAAQRKDGQAVSVDADVSVRVFRPASARDNPGDGCPNAALLDEIGRCADAIRQAYTDSVLVFIDGLAARMAPQDPPAARVKALSLLGLMVGTLQLARALTDRQLSDDLLEQSLRNALALLGAEQHG